jgi:hypothetical protein
MFVYIWKRLDGTPFYVGMTKNAGRTNPLNSGGRGWLCKQTLETIGRTNVITEVHNAPTVEVAKEMERAFILQYGRIQLGTGPLTNLKPGGDGSPGMSDDAKLLLSERMKINNPTFNPEVRAKIKARMASPDVKEKFLGDSNPAKRPEVRAKLKAKWQEPEYQETQRNARTGLKRHTEEHKAKLRDKLLDPNNPMREYHKTLNTDPTIKAKRNAALQTPEVRARISAKLKEKWAERKANIFKPQI